jgi:hypothetical protein
MLDEPSGSCSPVQQAPSKRRPTCGQAKPLTDFSAAGHGGPASFCLDCQRAASRLASRRRQAAMRLLIAAHPEEWAGLLGLVRARRHVGDTRSTGGARRA